MAGQDMAEMGRPRAEIDWEQFEKLIWIPVLSSEQLSDILGVSKRTLERHVKDKYDLTIDAVREQKQGPMRQRLFSSLWKNATEQGNVAAQIWLTKNIFGWRDHREQVSVEKQDDKLVIQFNTPTCEAV